MGRIQTGLFELRLAQEIEDGRRQFVALPGSTLARD